MLTPVFGTACPPKGISGIMRRYAYDSFSEGQSAHWLLLMAADRVDALESAIGSAARGRPDNPITETGILSEFTHHGLSSRLGKNRVDVKHQPLDALIVAAPWLMAGYAVGKAIQHFRRGDDRRPPLPPG